MSSLSRHHYPTTAVHGSTVANDLAVDPSIRSQRHNLKLASDHRPRFSNPFDDCLDSLVNFLWSYVRSQHTDPTIPFSESSLPASLVKRARSVAPKGSKWTVWVSTELRDKFAGAKETFASRWTHAEFVELMLIVRDSNGTPADRTGGVLLPKPVQHGCMRSGAPVAPSSLLSKSLNSQPLASSFRKPPVAPITKHVALEAPSKGRRVSQLQAVPRSLADSAGVSTYHNAYIPRDSANHTSVGDHATVVPSKVSPLNFPAPQAIERRRASMPALPAPTRRGLSASLPSRRGLVIDGWYTARRSGGATYGVESASDLSDDDNNEDDDYENDEDTLEDDDDEEDDDNGLVSVWDDIIDSSKAKPRDVELHYDLLPPDDDSSLFQDLSSDYFPFGAPPPSSQNAVDTTLQATQDLQYQQYTMMFMMEQQLQLQQQQLQLQHNRSPGFKGSEAPPPFYATTARAPSESERLTWQMDDEKLPRELFEQMILVDDDSDEEEIKPDSAAQEQQQQVIGGWSGPHYPVTTVGLHHSTADSDILDALIDAKKFMSIVASASPQTQGPPPSFHPPSTASHPYRSATNLHSIAQVASEAFGIPAASLISQQKEVPRDLKGYSSHYFDELPPYLDEGLASSMPHVTFTSTVSAEPVNDMEWSDASAFHIETDELGPIGDATWPLSGGEVPPGVEYEEYLDFSDETKGGTETVASAATTTTTTVKDQRHDAEPLPPYIGRTVANAPQAEVAPASAPDERGLMGRVREVVVDEKEAVEAVAAPSGHVDPPPYIAASTLTGEVACREGFSKSLDSVTVNGASSLPSSSTALTQPLQSWSETRWRGGTSENWEGTEWGTDSDGESVSGKVEEDGDGDYVMDG
ncbi:hypothetical protein HDU67_004281 [Dinochytrium kinnereticum]|nr:hypothetical protein HDU67_004281 [Dinochytrium kinnereticum]